MSCRAASKRERLSCWRSARTRLDWKNSVTIFESEYMTLTPSKFGESSETDVVLTDALVLSLL